jgi:hypothetical protein
MNKLEPGEEPAPGEKVVLKGKAPTNLFYRQKQNLQIVLKVLAY